MSLIRGRSSLRLALIPVAIVALAAAGGGATATGSSPRKVQAAPVASAILTSPNGERQGAPLQPTTGYVSARVVVDTQSPGQEWHGVGGALTDASVELLSGNDSAVRALFDPADPSGARLNLVRLPLSSTDFSRTLWTWGWDGERAHPPTQAVAAADLLLGEIAPLVGDDLAVNAVAWSAPAQMKTTGSLRGGALRTDAEGAYGDMLVSQVETLLAAGVPVRWLSLGNEPGHSADYTTMTMTVDQHARIARAVAPRLDELGVDLLALDHNWSYRGAVDELLAKAPYDAVAWHCYDGDFSQAAGVPVDSMITECTGTDDSASGTFTWDSRNLVAGPAALGNSALWFFNLVLDDHHGPVDTGSTQGCKTCRGLGRLGPQGGAFEPEFFVAAHLTRAAVPGSRYLPVSVSNGQISAAAFRHPDGTVGIYAHNSSMFTRTVSFGDGRGASWSFRIPAGDLATITVR